MSAPSSISSRRTFWPAGPGLVRDELHAEDLAGALAHFVDRARDLDAAALAAAAGVDLRLHDPHRPAELTSPPHRLVDGERRNAARHRHAVAAEELLALVLVDLHVAVLLRSRVRQPHRGTTSGSTRRTVSVVVSSAWQRSSWNGLLVALVLALRRPANVCTAAVGRYAEQLGEVRAALHAAQRVVQALAEALDEVRADELADTPDRCGRTRRDTACRR